MAGSPAPLTAIICSHARPQYLAACLEGFRAQQGGPPRLLVVDSASPIPASNAMREMATAAGADFLRVDQPGLSLARNAGLAAAESDWVAYLDDDAVPAADWTAALLHRIAGLPADIAAIGGRILPEWEAPLPGWWPASLRGVLTIVEWPGAAPLGPGLPPDVAVYGANMAFEAAALRGIGGFPEALGRIGNRLLSGEEVEVLDRLRAAGRRAFYDGAITVRHSIQGQRLRPGWLLQRLHWQGATDALRDRQQGGLRRSVLAAAKLGLQAPLLAWPAASPGLLRARCGAAYNAGYLRGRLGGLG